MAGSMDGIDELEKENESRRPNDELPVKCFCSRSVPGTGSIVYISFVRANHSVKMCAQSPH